MSKFVVSARKYRPTTFDEVIGQNHVAKTLKNALQTDKLAHAFLFCGPRGVGKTTCARILAKVINCENPVNEVEPCNTCSSCKSFSENASFNIIELDAASNNSVEHIRTLIEQVRFQPQQGTHKVFIIDEVHMLSQAAFNAFLKTLEEPPPYAIFILATTEKHKIIPTILSRCQIFDFKRIQVEDIVIQLEKICEQEGKKADPEALHLIGQKADGAMRDALSIFDKIASSTGNEITYKDVITNLNILDYDYFFKIVDCFLQEDLAGVLLLLDDIIRSGFETSLVVEGLSNHIRDLLVAKDARTLTLLEVSDKLKERYQHQAVLAKKGMLLSGMDILNQCAINLPRANNKRLYVEIALSKITFANRAIEANVNGEVQVFEKKTNVVNGFDQIESQKEEKPSKISENESKSSKNSTKSPDPDPEAAIKVEEKEVRAAQEEEQPKTASEPIAEKQPEKEPAPSEPDQKIVALGNINQLLQQVKKDDAQIRAAQANLSIDGVKKVWEQYLLEVKESKSVVTALKTTVISLEDKVVKIIVPNNLIKDMINHEEKLIENLRTELGTPDLVYEFTIDKSAFPEIEEKKPLRVLNDKEKMQFFAENNSTFKDLADKFGLKPG